MMKQVRLCIWVGCVLHRTNSILQTKLLFQNVCEPKSNQVDTTAQNSVNRPLKVKEFYLPFNRQGHTGTDPQFYQLRELNPHNGDL